MFSAKPTVDLFINLQGCIIKRVVTQEPLCGYYIVPQDVFNHVIEHLMRLYVSWVKYQDDHMGRGHVSSVTGAFLWS